MLVQQEEQRTVASPWQIVAETAARIAHEAINDKKRDTLVRAGQQLMTALAQGGIVVRPPCLKPIVVGTHIGLTQREIQVLLGMSRGYSNAEIGRGLYLTEDTIKTHARRLYRKLDARDRAHAVRIGFEKGVLS